MLEREGLVHGEANRGFTVRSFTTADVLAAYDVRSVLEGYACRVAAERGLTEQQELTLDGCLREGERLLAAGFFDANSIRAWTEMNGRFHATLVQASHNSALASALDLINQHPLAAPTSIVFGMNNLERLFRHMQQAQEDHAVVLTALRRRQVVRAEALMAEHIFKSRENLHDEIRRRGNDVPRPAQAAGQPPDEQTTRRGAAIMKLVKIEREGRTAQGVLEGDHVHLAGPWTLGPVDRAPFKLSSLPPDLIIGMLQAGETVRLSDVSLAVPLDPLNKLICAGVNYRDHAGEIKADEPKNPVIFIRTIDTLVPHGQPVIKPRVSDTFDFEGEIAIVIGKGGRHIPEDSAMTHVSGYTCFMDGSVREYQRHAVTSGKNFWRSGSMGPWVVTPDEVGRCRHEARHRAEWSDCAVVSGQFDDF